jgi:hypothetical protein
MPFLPVYILNHRAFKILNAYAPYGLSAKLILGAIITAFTGAGFIGYVSDYATYWYAYNAGIRAPLEGVPYIKAAVTATSVFLLLSGGLIFAFSILAVRLTLNLIRSNIISLKHYLGIIEITVDNNRVFPPDYDSIVTTIHSWSFWPKIAFVLFSSAVITAVVYGFDNLPSLPLSLPGRINNVFVAPLSRNTFGLIFVFSTCTFGALAFPRIIWPLGFFLVTLYFATCLWLMFQPLHYSNFLRIIGYGGGLPVVLKCKESDAKTEVCQGETSLILRTNETLILFKKNSEHFYEVPKDSFTYVSYQTGGLINLPPMLPRK